MSILMSHMMVTKNPQNVLRKYFWAILMTLISDVKFDINICEPYYVFFLQTSCIVQIFGLWLAVRARGFRISGGDSCYSWVLICEVGVLDYNAGWGVGYVGSSQYLLANCKSLSPQGHPHWKNTSTQLQYSLYCYSWRLVTDRRWK